MPAKNISLSDELREFIQQRDNVDDIGTATEYARHLIRIDKSKEADRQSDTDGMYSLKNNATSNT